MRGNPHSHVFIGLKFYLSSKTKLEAMSLFSHTYQMVIFWGRSNIPPTYTKEGKLMNYIFINFLAGSLGQVIHSHPAVLYFLALYILQKGFQYVIWFDSHKQYNK